MIKEMLLNISIGKRKICHLKDKTTTLNLFFSRLTLKSLKAFCLSSFVWPQTHVILLSSLALIRIYSQAYLGSNKKAKFWTCFNKEILVIIESSISSVYF